MMPLLSDSDPVGAPGMAAPRVAVIGAGVAGSACASGLWRAGFEVTVFDKSRGVGGRMATRRAQWTDFDGTPHVAEFDHGCPHFTATRPRFQAVVERAEARGSLARWRQHLYAAFPAPRLRHVLVPTPHMPAFCRQLLGDVPLRLDHAVTGLRREADGWYLHFAAGGAAGPFDQVALALPPAQAAALLGAHQQDWSAALAAVRMNPCWTLMAETDDIDWPWDAAEPERGPLAWVARNDRKPGRHVAAAGHPGAGAVQWVAHATPAWSLEHLEDDAIEVTEALLAALGRLLGGGGPARWQHASVHRWRYAQRAEPAADGIDCLWSAELGLGVCGDAFGQGTVEAAWCSGDELADTIAAAAETVLEASLVPLTSRVDVSSRVPSPFPTGALPCPTAAVSF